MTGRDRSTFWHDGQRYELRPWHDAPTKGERAAGISVVQGEAQARFILGGALRGGGPLAGALQPAFPEWFDAGHDPAGGRVDRLLEELRLGQRLLVLVKPRIVVDGFGPLHEHVVDLADLAGPEPLEQTWVEFVFEYPDGTKVSGIEYVLVDPANAEARGTLAKSGTITRRGVAPGEYTVVLKDIEHAVWVQARANRDDELKLIARTSGYSDGKAATVKLYRERVESPGDELATVQAEVHGDVIEATLRYDAAADPHAEHETESIGLIAEVSLDGGKVWAKTPRALQLKPQALRSVQWSAAQAQAGDMLEIVVDAPGHPAGTEVALELWRLDWIEGDAKICDIGPIPISGGRASARVAYAADGSGPSDATIDACGEYYVIAKIDGAAPRTATSALLWCAWSSAADEESAAGSEPETDTRAA